jgi:hypothetical protein
MSGGDSVPNPDYLEIVVLFFFLKDRCHFVAQASLKFYNPPASVSQAVWLQVEAPWGESNLKCLPFSW